MESLETSTSNPIDGQESPGKSSDHLDELHLENVSLAAELEVLRISYRDLHLLYKERETSFLQIEQQKGEVLKQNSDLIEAIKEISSERNYLHDELYKIKDSFREREDQICSEKEEIEKEVQHCNHKIKELSDEKIDIIRLFSENLEVVRLIKKGLVRVIESLEADEVGILDRVEKGKSDELDLDEELSNFLWELKGVSEFVNEVELKVEEYKEKRKKERKELENSVVSLTEENRDINSLLRIALVEKEAVEKSLNKLKGNNEQKRAAILQIAERGLQRVGFGFMVGATGNEQAPENSYSVANTSVKSDSSECEEEVVSLATTMERIMKNLRLEITQLRRSLDESRLEKECHLRALEGESTKLQTKSIRSETDRLQSLTEQQSCKLAENMIYIKELEDREQMLTENIDKLLVQIEENREEVARWREACELEVEAGKNAIEERERVVSILKQELEKARASLGLLNGKLKLKEELVATAIAAREAAERSLKLADSRVAGLHARIEELTKQLEEAEKRERANRIRVRYICWPWRALKSNAANTTTSSRVSHVKRMIPEMQALLH